VPHSKKHAKGKKEMELEKENTKQEEEKTGTESTKVGKFTKKRKNIC
jgi:hypothetical protein